METVGPPQCGPDSWRRSRHRRFVLVSPWMSEGDLLDYLRKFPNANRVSIVRAHVIHAGELLLSLAPEMIGVADGLSYLHSNDIVHGSLKGVSQVNLESFVGLPLCRRRRFCSMTRGSHESLTSGSLQSPSASCQNLHPSYFTATLFDGAHLKFWEH